MAVAGKTLRQIQYPVPAKSTGGIPSVSGPGTTEDYSFLKESDPERYAYYQKQYGPSGGSSSATGASAGTGAGSSGADASAGGAGAGLGGAKVVMPEASTMPPSMAALSGDMGGGDIGDAVGISGPSRFRQGIGQRIPPTESMNFLKRAY